MDRSRHPDKLILPYQNTAKQKNKYGLGPCTFETSGKVILFTDLPAGK
jgi:hypothetical protein